MKFRSQAFFYPKTIAIIGASTKPFKFGGRALSVLREYEYSGRIYPVNAGAVARGEKIQGLDACLLEELSEPIDLAYITVPREKIPQELRKCAKKHIRNIIILTAGFKETDEEGKCLEQECAEIANENDIQVIGPNCFGIYNPKGGITLLPGDEFPKETGDIALLSQSGGHSVNFVLLGQSDGLRFSKVISYGNALNLDLPDFLEYLNEDSETNIIAAYTEGVRDINKLRSVINKLDKPLIIWKAGLTKDGARAAASHTGFLSGQAEIWRGFFKQYKNKLVAVNNFEELLDTTKAFAYLPLLRNNEIHYGEQIGIIGGGGGIGIELSDVANQYGLKIPKITQETKKKLSQLLPIEGTSVNNPLDIGNPLYMGEQKRILNIFMEDPHISVLIYDFIVDFVMDLKLMYRIIRNFKEKNNIPIIIILRHLLKPAGSLASEKIYRKFRDKFQAIKIPIYPSFYRGVRALANYLKYYQA
jgi:acyl-CoA synthetase (NDP forming)